MHKNNLFIKICLWFWLTTLFMIGGVIAVDWLTESGPFGSPRPPMHGGPLVSQGLAMAWIYEEEGVSALGRFAARLRELDGIRVRLLDGNGVDLTGGTSTTPAIAPPSTAQAGQTPAARSGPMGPDPEDWRPVSLAVTGPTGRTYTLLAKLPPRPPGPGGPPSWGMTLIRLIVVLTVSGFICYWLARYLTAPVLKIGAAARRLAAGDLSARVSPALGKRNDELARLALDFDWMAERIGSLLNGQRTLLRDISHELRSPLARLNVALELCRKEAGREAAGALDRIERESGRLNDMIGHLLTLNRVESDPAVRKTGRIDLAGLVREIAADAEFEAGALERAVKVTALESFDMEGDEEMIRRAIENVVRNAVRYTREGGDVEISLRLDGSGPIGTAVIAVRDHGKGVPQAALAHLFQPFYRVGDGRERETGGTGLGLAITEAAVRLHGGSVGAANAPGDGLIVEIRLPASPEGNRPR